MIPLLVTNPTNIRYLTGFVGVERGDAWLVISGDKKYLITNSLYAESAKQLQCEIIVSTNFAASVETLGFKVLEFEENNLTVSEFKKFSIKLVGVRGKIEQMRMIKRIDELAHIRLAQKITLQAFQFIKKRLKPGTTEARLAYELEGYLKIKGGDLAFTPIVAFNDHASQPHYAKRGNSPLRRGSLVLLDFGAKVHGYCGDLTRTIFFGPPQKEWKAAFDAVAAAQKKAIDMLASGVRNGATLDAAAKEVIAEAGFPPYQHSLGHNIGLDVHEAPRLTNKKEEMLVPGMVFSIEPGIYIEGKYGIRIEDLVLLKDKGVEILT